MSTPIAPRILILEPDRESRAGLIRLAIKGWAGASVQGAGGTLDDVLADTERLQTFDVLLVSCDFSEDGTSGNSVLRAVRAVSADPANPAVVLLTTQGSEYTAVQAMRSGAFDCIPKHLVGRERIEAVVHQALAERGGSRQALDAPRLFGYDTRRRLALRENVSVFVAHSAEHGKEVVLKVLHRGPGSLSRDENFRRFTNEFKVLYDIDDPAVAEIHDFRVTSRYCYMAMEYFSAGHLGERLGNEPLEPAEALGLAAEIAHALAIIHAAGVVHRDLKPANIMLREDGSIALIDFGISQSALLGEARPGDDDGVISGTPYYMSPEQASSAPTDERTDFYSLGVILYQMLTGRRPYVGETPKAILDQHRSAPLPRLPEHLGRHQPLLERLLAKEVSERVPTARELIEALDTARQSEMDDVAALACSA